MDSKILNHEKYLATLITKDVDECCNNIIEIVNDVFDEVAPTHKIKINNYKTKGNKNIKEAIKIRYKAYNKYKNNITNENKLEFKNLKYSTDKLIKKEEINEDI